MAVSKVQEHKIRKVMREFKAGTLTSGGSGSKVTDPKQAIAIAYSEARKASKERRKSPKDDSSPRHERGESASMKRMEARMEDSPMHTKMKGDSRMARMKRKKQMGDSIV